VADFFDLHAEVLHTSLTSVMKFVELERLKYPLHSTCLPLMRDHRREAGQERQFHCPQSIVSDAFVR
jgi:hypothetical protein